MKPEVCMNWIRRMAFYAYMDWRTYGLGVLWYGGSIDWKIYELVTDIWKSISPWNK